MSNSLREREIWLSKLLLAVGAGGMIGEGIACWQTGRPYTWLIAGGWLVLLGIFGLLRNRRWNNTQRK
jgi:hypothetical protein